MSDVDERSIATTDEIEAALAEAEAQKSAIPSLDDGNSDSLSEDVVPIPVEADLPAGTAIPRQAPNESEDNPRVVVTVHGEEAGESCPPSKTPVARASSLVDTCLHYLDRGLDLMHRPFRRLSPDTRQAVGALAIVTIVMSVLASTLLPILFPPRDAVTLLKNETQAVRQNTAPADDSSP